MKKATVYYVEKNAITGKKSRSKTIDIPDAMFDSWDWDGIVKIFRVKVSPYVFRDSTVYVTRIKLGRATLQG